MAPSATHVPQQETTARQTALFLIQAFVSSRLLGMAAKLRIPDLLAERPHTTESIAAAVGIEPENMYRLLRGFTASGLLRHREDDTFELTAVGDCLKTGPMSLRDLAVRTYDVDYPAWGVLLEAMQSRTVPFDAVFGTGFYQYLSTHQDAGDAFNRAMAVMTLGVGPALLEAYAFPPVGRVIDVGGGTGEFLTSILRAHPALTGVLYDRPAALAGVSAPLQQHDLVHRCTVVEGDMFHGVPAGGDVYLLKLVLHNWNDAAAATILQQCRRVIPHSGRLLIAEHVMPDRIDSRAVPVVGSDLLMFVLLGGRERTEREFATLLADTGFAMTRVIPSASPLSWIEARPC